VRTLVGTFASRMIEAGIAVLKKGPKLHT
jgi:hypothetical protein